jgi:hypothetical protein
MRKGFMATATAALTIGVAACGGGGGKVNAGNAPFVLGDKTCAELAQQVPGPFDSIEGSCQEGGTYHMALMYRWDDQPHCLTVVENKAVGWWIDGERQEGPLPNLTVAHDRACNR